MKPRLPIYYLILIYTLLAVFTRAQEECPTPITSAPAAIDPIRPGDPGNHPSPRSRPVPEPGAIGLVAVLAVLLAMQRRRD